ncbi:FIG015547: peptidase, M16 family [hydrothermal vent metagenome]|uniref:FIG015547: peptidase, M16 family n=1 Tax=hydrothermal vent metagenome TaxID=652676 RepID=A0A3B1A888_9ZZZZ
MNKRLSTTRSFTRPAAQWGATLFLLSIGFIAIAEAPSAKPHVFESTLDNGLKVLVKPDHRAPVVVAQIWYKVGSSYEVGGSTGLSHILEHMMFKGTAKLAPGKFSKVIAENGGRENAFTGKDYTAYFQQLEKSRLPVSFELEADRMRNLTLPEEEFSKELPVVMEERRLRTEDKPRSRTYEQFNAIAHISSPYHHPVIGWMDDLKNMKVADLRAWYQKWYAPNNATLVVVGDVKPDEVFALAKKHYGPLKRSNNIPVLKPRIEAPQFGERRLTVKLPAKLPYLIIGYKVPSLNTVKEDWEPYALEVLAGILSGGDSARLPKELVRGRQMAASADVSYDMISRQAGLFIFDAIPSAKFTVADVEKALYQQMEKVKTELVTVKELQRVKAQVVAGDIYEKDSIFYQAMILGQLETVGLPWTMADEYVDKIRAVTAEQVQAVAKKYFKDAQKTVAILEPQQDK